MNWFKSHPKQAEGRLNRDKSNAERIDAAIRLIKLWKKNIRFIKKRIEIQNDLGGQEWEQITAQGYVRRDFYPTRTYGPIDIQIEQDKIDKAKEILKTL